MIEVKEQLRDVDTVSPIDGRTCVVAGHPQKAFIKEYILQYDNDFYEPLSTRVEMEAFSQKLSDLSITFVIYKDVEVAGLICSYFYDPASKAGFITLVHTKHEYRGQHLSLYLLNAVKDYALKNGFERITLFVSKQQTSAFQLYSRHGFNVLSEEKNGRCKMECELNNSFII